MIEKTEPTFTVDIFMAGDLATAKQVCREYCYRVGLCVTVTPADFIYTGGEEAGVRIGLLNYPRFPSSQEDIEGAANGLAMELLERLCQHSVLLVSPSRTTWVTRRDENGR